MAKQVSQWVCELCGKAYEKEHQAVACEAQHFFTELQMEQNKPYPQRIMVSLSYPTKDVNAVYELKFINSVEPEYQPVVIDDLKLFETLLDVQKLFIIPDKDWRETSVLYVESGIREITIGGILTPKQVEEKGYIFGLFEKDGDYFTLSYTFPKNGSPHHYVQHNPVERKDVNLEEELWEIEKGESRAKHTERYREVLGRQIALHQGVRINS